MARTRSVAERLGLPADLDELRQSSGQALPAEALIEGLAHDKKGSYGSPEFILLDALGKPSLGIELDQKFLAGLLRSKPYQL